MEIKYIHSDIARFLESLEDATRAKTTRLIKLLAVEEYHLGMPYSKKLEKDLYELRALGIQNVRVFYTFYQGVIVLLHAVSKKTQKLEKKDIETARKRLHMLQS